MTKYILSYTPLMKDKKEFVLAINEHKNVYNDNNYIVAFNPWSSYSAEIIDDMVEARKRRIKASRVLLKDAEPIKNVDAVVDDKLMKSKLQHVTGKRVERGATGKVVKETRVLSKKLESGISLLKTKIDDELVNFLSIKDGNIVMFIDTISKMIAKESTLIGMEWAESIKSGTVESLEMSEHIKDIFTALKVDVDKSKGSPVRFMNTEQTISTLLHKLGYRSDEITRTGDLKKIIIGDQIGTQINAILLQNIYRATDVALNMYKLKDKSMKLMSVDTPLRQTSILVSEKTADNLDQVSYFSEATNDDMESANTTYVMDGVNVARDVGNLIANNEMHNNTEHVIARKAESSFPTAVVSNSESPNAVNVVNGNVINLYSGKVVNNKEVTNIFKLYDAIALVDSTTSKGFTQEKARVNKVSFVRDLLANETAKMKLSVNGSDIMDLLDMRVISTADSGNTMTTDKAVITFDDKHGVIHNGEEMDVTYVSWKGQIQGDDLSKPSFVSWNGQIQGDELASISFVSWDGKIGGSSTAKTSFVSWEGVVDGDSLAKNSVSQNGGIVDSIEKSKPSISQSNTIVEKREEATPSLGNKCIVIEDVLAKFISTNTGGAIGELEDMRFSFTVESKLQRIEDSKVIPSIETVITSDNEYGMVDEGIIDTVLSFLTEASESNMSIDVQFERVEQVNSETGVKDVELSTYNSVEGTGYDDVSINVMDSYTTKDNLRDTFITVIGSSEHRSEKEVRLNSLEYANSFNADVDTLLDRLDKFSQANSNKEVYYEKLESVDNLVGTYDTELGGLSSLNPVSAIKDIDLNELDSSKADGGIVNVDLGEFDSSLNSEILRDTDLGSLDMSVYSLAPIDTTLETMESSKYHEGFSDVTLDTLDTSQGIESFKDVGLDALGRFQMSDVGKDVAMEYFDTSKPSLLNLDVALEKFDTTDVQQSLIDTGISVLQVVNVGEMDNDVALSKFEKVNFDIGVDDVALDKLSKDEHLMSIRDTALDTMTKVDPNVTIKDTELDRADKAFKYKEYEGQMNDNSDLGTSERSLVTDFIAEMEDGTRYNEYEVEQPHEHETGLKQINHSIEIMVGDEGYSDMGYTSEGVAEIEEADKYNSYEAEHSPEVEQGLKTINHSISIGDRDYGEVERDVKVTVSETEVSDRYNEHEVQYNDVDAYTKHITHKMEIGDSNIGDIDREFKMSESQQESYIKDKMKVNLVINGREEGHNDREYRTDVSDKDLGRKETEIDMGNIPDGEGGEVIPKDPTPVTPKDPKQKIWSIMGKNYPSWQNWNPKKTR